MTVDAVRTREDLPVAIGRAMTQLIPKDTAEAAAEMNRGIVPKIAGTWIPRLSLRSTLLVLTVKLDWLISKGSLGNLVKRGSVLWKTTMPSWTMRTTRVPCKLSKKWMDASLWTEKCWRSNNHVCNNSTLISLYLWSQISSCWNYFSLIGLITFIIWPNFNVLKITLLNFWWISCSGWNLRMIRYFNGLKLMLSEW